MDYGKIEDAEELSINNPILLDLKLEWRELNSEIRYIEGHLEQTGGQDPYLWKKTLVKLKERMYTVEGLIDKENLGGI